MHSIRLSIHGAMLADSERNEAFRKAIEAVVRPGDVVVDVGAGSGLLSLMAARAGARKVYAVESSPLAAVCGRIADLNGFGGTIDVQMMDSRRWISPEPADVVISETLGVAAFEEGFLNTMQDARDRFLRPGGTLIPRRLKVLLAPVEIPPALSHFRNIRTLEGFDFSPLSRILAQVYQRAYVPYRSELAEFQILWDIDCQTARASGALKATAEFVIGRSGLLAGFAMWFEAELAPGIWLSSRSPLPQNHWGQAFLGAEDIVTVEEGVSVRLNVSAIEESGSTKFIWTNVIANEHLVEG